MLVKFWLGLVWLGRVNLGQVGLIFPTSKTYIEKVECQLDKLALGDSDVPGAVGQRLVVFRKVVAGEDSTGTSQLFVANQEEENYWVKMVKIFPVIQGDLKLN